MTLHRDRMWVRAGACAVAVWLAVAVTVDAQEAAAPGAQSAPTEQTTPPEEAKKKKKGFGLKGLTSSIAQIGGRVEVPTMQLLGNAVYPHSLRAKSAWEEIGQTLSRPSVCDRGVDAINPVEQTQWPGIEKEIIEALVVPMGYRASDFTFEWEESDVANCRTDLRRKNTFRCTTALLNITVTNEAGGEPRAIKPFELAFIFAHEIAHLVRGHDAGAAQRAKRAELVQDLASTAALVGALAEARYTRDATGALRTEIGVDSLSAVWLSASIGQILADSSCDLAGADHAKDEESEADFFAIDMLMRSQWPDPKNPGRFISGRQRFAEAETVAVLRSLKGKSDEGFTRTQGTLSGGISEFASRKLLENLTGQSLNQSGLGTSQQTFLRTQIFKLGVSLYSDYRLRQGLAFHPDPLKRAERIGLYREAAWKQEIAADLAQSGERLRARREAAAKQAAATPAAPEPADQMSAEQMEALRVSVAELDRKFESNRATTQQLVELAVAAPEDLILKLIELQRLTDDVPAPPAADATPEAKEAATRAATERTARIATLTGEVETLRRAIRPNQAANPDFALAQYFAFKKDKPTALRYALAATTKQRSSPDMFIFAAEMQIEGDQRPAALQTLQLGATQFGETQFYPLLIRIHTLDKNDTVLAEVRQRCLADAEAPPATKQLCVAPGQQVPGAAATPAAAAPANPLGGLGSALQRIGAPKTPTPAPATPPPAESGKK